MFSFILVLTFIFVGFALIFKEFSKSEEYKDQIYMTYKVLYGTYDDSNYGVSEKIVLSLILFLLNVVFLNMLISIMADTYAQVQEKKVLIDSLTRLDLILEIISYMRTFSRNTQVNKGFLIYCGPAKTDEDVDSEAAEWEAKMKVIRSMVKQNDQNVLETKASMERKMDSLEKKLEKKLTEMNEKIERVEEGVIFHVKDVLEANRKDMTELLSRMETLFKETKT